MFVLFLSLIIGFPRSLDGQGHELTKNPGSFAPGEPIGRGQEAQFKETNLNEILNVSTKASGESSGIRTISGELIPRAKDHATGNTPPKSTGTDISKNANPNPSSTVKAEQPQGAPDKPPINTNQGQPLVPGTPLGPNTGEALGSMSPGEPLGPNGHFVPGEPIGSGQVAKFKEVSLNEILNPGPKGSVGIRTVSGELIPRPIDQPTGNVPPKSTGPDTFNTPSIGVSVGSADKTTT
ncbi:hypothetical protein DPMN_013674 [Dreissena polymorpha]|uniref:Uncharacterized protein n=2 Tax=Dreissena polymorpha TaxID=45954 RepID=A0A9D4N8C1_DREPO|nr:hypothetical protein DPMN_013674 [Dreissena polymorpha]